MAKWIYLFECLKCKTTWQRVVLGSKIGFGPYSNPCPNCGPAPSRKISETKVK